MIKRFLSLLWILHLVQDGVSQYFICPYENGLYYTTSPDCLLYYRCQNRKLWSGVCFPWQKFDVHSLSCRYGESVDCNPEYAGIWRPLYGDESNVINQEAQETNQVIADEGIQGEADEETVMLGNEGEEDIQQEAQEETSNNAAEQEEIQEAQEDEAVMLGNEDKEGIQEAKKEGMIANEGEYIQEQSAEEFAGNKPEEVDNLKTAQGEQTADDLVLNEETEAILQEKDSDDEHEVNNKLVINEAQLDDEQSQNAVMASNGKFLPKLFKNIPIARESIIPDLMLPIVTSVLIEESSTESKGVTDNVDQETNCQLSTPYAGMEPFVESITEETKQEDSSGNFWYWCGSGRFVLTQTPQDPNTICEQLEDPQFIDQEGTGTGTQDWGGHTFLGSDTSVSK